MSTWQGWGPIEYAQPIPITLTADTTEGQLITVAGAVAGAGDVAIGVIDEAVDISEDGANKDIRTAGICVGFAAAAVTAGDPVKPAATGTITPVASDKDFYVGRALTSQATVGGIVKYIWQPGYYAV